MKTKYLAPLFMALLIGAGVFYLHRQKSDQPDMETFIDRLVGSGIQFSPSPVEMDLMEYRKLVLATDVNPASSQRIITALLLLDSRDHEKPIDLYIRTEGGWISDAFGVIDIIKAIKAPVNTHAVGGTHSAGAIILASGTGVRYAYPSASIMFHAGIFEDDGDYGENTIDNKRLITFWEKHAKLPSEWLHSTDDTSYFLTPDKALEYGIVDQIMEKNS